jgi:citrate lyase subunit beta/citryl-CoA lyase
MIIRSLLFLPANSVRMIVKAATLPTDAAILDLEDAVALDDKETARILAKDYVRLIKRRGIHTFVRVNSLGTGLTAKDLQAVVVKGLDGVMLPKTETGANVAKAAKMLERMEKKARLTAESVKLIPQIESARGVENSLPIAEASSRIVAVAFGAGDYYRDLGRDVTSLSEDENELLYARSRIVNAGRAAGIQAIDTPFLGSLVDRETFLRETRLAVRLGFKGKLCVHPSQVEPINDLFSSSQEEVSRAKRIVDAFEEAQARGLAAISFEGKMVDIMTYRQAKDVIAAGQAIEAKRERMTNLESYVPVKDVFAAK